MINTESTAYNAPATVIAPLKGNRLKFLLSLLPWKKEIRMNVSTAAIFISKPQDPNAYPASEIKLADTQRCRLSK